jgi:hypothetical protein
MNYKFDLDAWLPRFPLRPRHNSYAGEIITGPSHACNNEHLRSELYDQVDWGTPAPVDVFVFADGEPADRRVTKIGGLPFRPTGSSWPVGDDGHPLTFVAQLNFSDSRDITDNLPADLLLVFTDSSQGQFGDFYFEWQNLKPTELVTAEELPEQGIRFDPCYGHVFRTMSYPNAERITRRDVQKYARCRGVDVQGFEYLMRYQATQIGEAPYLIQQGDDDLPGRILCTISSVHPDAHGPFPFVNRPEPLAPEEKWVGDGHLMIGDVGCLYIAIDSDGNLHGRASCY